ncbi:MAG: thioredoxin [Lachnospiraceae bacterium]|nr:thioredoxin [Lachnospiraceae bacterium]
MSEIALNSGNFDEIVLKSDKPVLVDFWAPWCGPCKMFAPTLAKFADASEGKVVVGKVNVDEEQELAMKFNISSIPSLLVFINGEVAARKVGGLDLNGLNDFTNV